MGAKSSTNMEDEKKRYVKQAESKIQMKRRRVDGVGRRAAQGGRVGGI